MSGCIGTQMMISSVKNPSDGEPTLPIVSCPMGARNIRSGGGTTDRKEAEQKYAAQDTVLNGLERTDYEIRVA
jgi:hypothetical protein